MGKHVEFPFNAWSRKHIRNLEKFCTSRNRHLCEVNDYFIIESVLYIVFAIEKHKLGYVRNLLYSAEGASSPEEFDKIWRIVSRKKKDTPINYEKNVFVHWFRPVEDPDEFMRNRKLNEFVEIGDV